MKQGWPEIEALPGVKGAFAEATGALPWRGRSRPDLAAAALARVPDRAPVLHYGCRDGSLTVALAKAGGRGQPRAAGVLAADHWVPTVSDWSRFTAPPLAEMPLPERRKRCFHDLLVRERLTGRVAPLVADAASLAALCRSRGLRFRLVVASLHLLYATAEQRLAEIGTLLELVGSGGTLVAALPDTPGLHAEAVCSLEARAVIGGDTDLLILTPRADAIAPPAPPGAVRVARTSRDIDADSPTIDVAALRPRRDAIVRAGETRFDMPESVVALDAPGFDPAGLFAQPRERFLDYLVLADGIANLEAEPDNRHAPGMAIADRSGRLLVDRPGTRSVLYHDLLQQRGLLDADTGGPLLRLPRDMREVAGTVFAGVAYDHYFHWHNDQLAHIPNLLDIAHASGSGPIRILTTAPLTDWRQRTLELMGLGAGAYVQVSPREPVRVQGTLVARRHPGWTTPKRAGEAFRRMADAAGAARGGLRRLYVSRADVGTRGVSNEGELWPALERLGFERIEAGRLAYDAKVRLFAEAAVCLGPHGAGFTHAGYMAPGGLLIEFVAAHYKRRPGFVPRLASVFGHRYGYMVAPGEPDARGNVRIEPDVLIPALERALGE